MEKHDTYYCDMEFWICLEKTLFEMKNSCVDLFGEPEEKFECVGSLWKSIKKAKNIFFDDEELFKQQLVEDTILSKLCKISKTSDETTYPHVSCEKHNFEKIKSLSDKEIVSGPIYLFARDNTIKSFENSGILSLDTDRCLTNRWFYRDFGPEIKKDDETNWKDILKGAEHSFNSMIIMDNFVLKLKKENILSIFDVLLPAKLDIPLHISIFAKNVSSIEAEYKQIMSELQKIRPEIKNIELTLYQCGQGDFHDRAIITNYLWIGSEGGFDLLKTNRFHYVSGKTTNVHIYFPYLQDSTKSAIAKYEDFIDEAKKLRNSSSFVGSRINRLLD